MIKTYGAVETKKKTDWRRTDPDVKTSAMIRCEYGMWWPKVAAQRPSFGITYTYRDDCFGRDAEVLGKHFPELLELLPFHLWHDTGSPMHYEANGLYWAEKHLGIFKLWPHDDGPEPADPEARGHLATTIGESVLGDTEDVERELRRLDTGDDNDATQTARRDFRAFLTSRLPRLKAAFDAAMRKRDVQMIDTENYAGVES